VIFGNQKIHGEKQQNENSNTAMESVPERQDMGSSADACARGFFREL
jgi:hypothetical protein